MSLIIRFFGYYRLRDTEKLARKLANILKIDVTADGVLAIPESSFNGVRNQHLSTLFLCELEKITSVDEISLGITDVDLFVPEMNFVFGEADLGGKAAIISVARLKQEFYGLPPDLDLLSLRTLKEAVHESGHMFGIAHCPDPKCVMHFSGSLPDTDFKGPDFCEKCKSLAFSAIPSRTSCQRWPNRSGRNR